MLIDEKGLPLSVPCLPPIMLPIYYARNMKNPPQQSRYAINSCMPLITPQYAEIIGSILDPS